MAKALLTEQDGHVLTVTLNRPEKKNAVNAEVLCGLSDAWHRLDEDEAIVQRAVAVSRLLGIEPSLGRGSTDSNIPISLGIPAITIGGGGQASGAHSLNEWFLNTDGTLGVKRALLILLAQAGVAVAS